MTMEIINKVAVWFLKKRIHQIKLFLDYPLDVQEELFQDLIHQAKDTIWGQLYDYQSIKTYSDFKARLPFSEYEDLKQYIERVRDGEEDVLWPGKVRWFAKSSGTTSDKSKFIPVTDESLTDCHYKGGKDMLALYYNNYPNSEVLNGKSIGVAGSSKPDLNTNRDGFVGDLSAILMNNLPIWAHITKTPQLSVVLMEDWDKKVELIANHTIEEDVRVISGVPSWMLVILHKVIAVTGKRYIDDVWPNFELIVHGGVNFSPYVRQFQSLFRKPINYLEVYNASEGFFAVQDSSERDDMLLMLDYGIFYEFIPIDDYYSDDPNAYSLSQVEIGKVYAMVISTNAGLWRYLIGDTIVFTSLKPFRIKITGRVKSFINVVGEELIVDNADRALASSCEHTKAILKEYTAAPVFSIDGNPIGHEWLLEFETEPADIEYFTNVLDNALKANNSDYEAKRYNDMVLKKPKVIVLKKGSFLKWLSWKGKLGGQNKVLRLSNNRIIIDEIINLIHNEKKQD